MFQTKSTNLRANIFYLILILYIRKLILFYMKQVIRLTEEKLYNLIGNCINEAISYLTEDFAHWKSPKLVQMVKQHGMPRYSDVGLNYMLTQLSDDDISDKVTNKPNGFKNIEFKDGTYLNIDTSNNETARGYFGSPSCNYLNDIVPKVRPNNGFARARANNPIPTDFYSRKHYAPMTSRGESAKSLRTNPYFMADKDKEFNRDSGWNRQEADRVMDNLRQRKDMYGKPNKRIK